MLGAGVIRMNKATHFPTSKTYYSTGNEEEKVQTDIWLISKDKMVVMVVVVMLVVLIVVVVGGDGGGADRDSMWGGG